MKIKSSQNLNSRPPAHRRLILALCVWLAFSLSEAAVAGNAPSSCTGWYTKFSEFAAGLVAPRDPLATLHPFVQNWLKFNAGEMKRYSIALKVGDSVKVDGISCQVVAVLGKGAEAPKGVYLVQTRSGLRVLKMFRDEGAMDRNFEAMKLYSAAQEAGTIDVTTAKTLRIDRAKSMALMEYAEGVDLQHIHLLYAEFGLSPKEANQIYSEWQKLRDSMKTAGIKDPADFNFIYNFKTKSFTLIDSAD